MQDTRLTENESPSSFIETAQGKRLLRRNAPICCNYQQFNFVSTRHTHHQDLIDFLLQKMRASKQNDKQNTVS